MKEALTEDTILVSVMMVNNEIGSILDVQELAKVVKDFDPQIVFHVDAIQAYGKMKIQPAKWQIDLMSVSGHKIHGPKGTGFLYMKDGTKIHPYIHGGGQQQGNEIGNGKCTWYRRTGTGGGKNGCFFDRAKRIPVWVKALFL